MARMWPRGDRVVTTTRPLSAVTPSEAEEAIREKGENIPLFPGTHILLKLCRLRRPVIRIRKKLAKTNVRRKLLDMLAAGFKF